MWFNITELFFPSEADDKPKTRLRSRSENWLLISKSDERFGDEVKVDSHDKEPYQVHDSKSYFVESHNEEEVVRPTHQMVTRKRQSPERPVSSYKRRLVEYDSPINNMTFDEPSTSLLTREDFPSLHFADKRKNAKKYLDRRLRSERRPSIHKPHNKFPGNKRPFYRNFCGRKI